MFIKQASETVNATFNFSGALGGGETITSIGTIAITPTDVTVVTSVISSDGSSIIVEFTGGTPGVTYAVSVTANTSANQVLVAIDRLVVSNVIVSPWQILIPIILRNMVGDTGPSPQYSDSRLWSLICTAGVLVEREVSFPVVYNIDIVNTSISPDPTGEPEFGFLFDEDFVALSCMKAAVMIADGEYRQAAKMAISHKDGPTHIDTKGIAANLKVIAENRFKEYDDARVAFIVGNGSVGKSILGPYNAFISVYAGNVSTLNTGSNRDDTASLFGGYG